MRVSNFSFTPASLTGSANPNRCGTSLYGSGVPSGADRSQEARMRKRMLSNDRIAVDNLASAGTEKKVFQGRSQANLAGDSFRYAESLRAGRTKAKDTALQKKQLRYDFKAISSQITRSKTSVNAKQVASKAKREVMRLKRLRQSGYDEEELQAAIVHAQAMERVAKKKARHLQEEELVKTGGPCEGDVKEKERLEEDELREQEEWNADNPEEETSDLESTEEQFLSEEFSEEALSWQEELFDRIASADPLTREALMSDEMSRMMDDMWESMQELLEDMGLEDLAEGLEGGVEREMDPADLKMMKIKHRTKEMKAITEADSEYLKAVFDKLERSKAMSVAAMAMGGGQSFSDSGASDTMSTGSVSSAVPSFEPGSMGIDISV